MNSLSQSHGRIALSWILAWQISKFWVENEEDRPSTANCIIIAQILHFPLSFQGQFCKLPLLRVVFNRKLGDYYAIRSIPSVLL